MVVESESSYTGTKGQPHSLMFNTSDDMPFTLRGGNDNATVLANRIVAINRINYLVRQKIPTFDLREKSQVYKDFLDLEMYRKYYSGDKEHVIDEEFCVRCAELCIELDTEEPEVNKEEFKKAVEDVKIPDKKENFISKFFKRK